VARSAPLRYKPNDYIGGAPPESGLAVRGRRDGTMARARIGAVLALALLALAAAPASQAGAHQLVEFEQGAALAANGTVPPVPSNPLEEVKEVCGSETNTWGSELLTTAPSEIKVKNEWGDIVSGKEMEISGKITHVEFSNGDIATDHPFSRDFTFNVLLDEPYWSLARSLGPGAPEGAGNESVTHEIHVEMEAGALLHAMPQREGPLSGEVWEELKTEPHVSTLTEEALEGIESAYVPKEGDRVAMKGRWIIDCGHNDFHSELHQITLAVFGHQVGATTQAHALTNPYRNSQLYGPSLGNVNAAPTGKPFPEGFEASVEALVRNAVFGFPAVSSLSLQSELERTLPSATPVKVCAPEGNLGKSSTTFSFTERKGEKVLVKKSKATHCAAIHTSLTASKYVAQQPRLRTCVMPWPWLSAKIAEALGVTGVKGNEVETITVNATGGTFTISYASETTAPIAFNATAKEVEEALEKLPVLKAGDITVTGGPGGTNPYVLTFGGELKEKSITPVTTHRSGLTGGAQLASVVVTKPGGELDLHRFVLSLIEQKAKIALEKAGQFEAITKIEEKMAVFPTTSCADPLSAPPVTGAHKATNNNQPFPFYGRLTEE
jgi:hypothetical protein